MYGIETINYINRQRAAEKALVLTPVESFDAIADRAIAAYRAGVDARLRRAELERTAAEARAESAQAKTRAERRARRLLVGLAAAAVLLVEHVWATRLANAVRAAQASLVLAERIPHAVIAEARESLLAAAAEAAAEA